MRRFFQHTLRGSPRSHFPVHRTSRNQGRISNTNATLNFFIPPSRMMSDLPSLSNVSIEKLYEKKSPIDHILLRPDTYVGSVQQQSTTMWIYDNSLGRMVERNVSYVPALVKIVDEILVNAADNKQRSKTMNELHVNIDIKMNRIEVINNGKGIPIVFHKEYNCYIPELVLGNLLTGSNFNDSVAKVTGGRNGYGAKLTNIFSKSFSVEIVNRKRKTKYKQEWTSNMSKKSEPEIEKLSNPIDDYTKISFSPDLSKFGLSSLNDLDVFDVMKTRVYDLAGCLDNVNVYFNGNLLPSGFESYINNFPVINNEDNNDLSSIITLQVNDRWKIGAALSPLHKFQHVSFVNSINTYRGGTHIQYISDQICSEIAKKIQKKDKTLSNTLINHVKQHLFIFVSCLVENPAFSSQTKEYLTTKSSDFGSECKIPPRFIKSLLENTELEDRVLQFVKLKQTTELNKGKRKTLKKQIQIPKLDDANWAGGKKGHECTLILTEGDSAKALAVAGLSILGRDKYGVFPLKGKLLNVRDASHSSICKNTEITSLVEILGLNYNNTYENSNPETWKMRYGNVMLMTDQDHDGSHIKGLVINFFHHFWPNLLKHDFLKQFITPIVKCTKSISKSKTKIDSFFSLPEYYEWRNNIIKENGIEQLKNWNIKYYKGLGTNTSNEAKEYFKNLENHQRVLKWDENSSNSIELAFSKSKSEERKNWLDNEFKEDIHVDSNNINLSISDFVNKELIQFSHADIVRSIPSIMDGLKPSQRKVLYGCFLKNLNQEIKVAQLAGYVSEKTSYHHGEASLHSTIISMAQNYQGSNNIPWLLPKGQFGTRLQGGNDHASARYIYTQLNSITRKIFREEDDKLLEYLYEDGYPAEPRYFIPIIPTVLINGCTGIGTGWSTSIPSYEPIQIINNVLKYINGNSMDEMLPYIYSFKGNMIKQDENHFISRGLFSSKNGKIIISELPYRKWTNSYKEHLEKVIATNDKDWKINRYKANYTETDVHFELDIDNDSPLWKYIDNDSIYKHLSIESTISTNNMHLFDSSGKIKKYNSPYDIIEEFIPIRLNYYEKRKEMKLQELDDNLSQLKNKKMFCEKVITKQIDLFNQSKSKIISDIKSHGITLQSDESYDNLLKLPLSTFTKEKMNSLDKEYSSTKKNLKIYQNTSVQSIWENELQIAQEAIMNVNNNN